MRTQLLRLRKRGFTLPEVLVTVTVVAVLAAVVVPAVTQYVGRGNGPASKNDINQVQNAINGFIVDTRTYPKTLFDLTGASAPAYATAVGGTWHGPYLSGTVTQTTGGSTGQGLGASGAQAGTAAFTSSGTSLALADTLLNTGTTIEAIVIFPIQCGALAKVDTLVDDAASATGNFRVYGSCATSTTNADSARLILATIGKP